MKYPALFATMLLSTPALAAVPTYDIDHSHTHIQFSVDHAGFSDLIGAFESYRGYFTFDEKTPEASAVEITIDVSSIETSSKELDGKLLGKDFFDAKQFPNIHFTSAKITRTGDNTGTLEGDLTMHGITKPFTFDVTFNKGGEFMGSYKVGFSATGKLKRSDFGLDKYVPTVSDEVTIHIETEGTRRDVTPKEKP